jgi:hypothetical protein
VVVSAKKNKQKQIERKMLRKEQAMYSQNDYYRGEAYRQAYRMERAMRNRSQATARVLPLPISSATPLVLITLILLSLIIIVNLSLGLSLLGL